jgi:hypothetical protein
MIPLALLYQELVQHKFVEFIAKHKMGNEIRLKNILYNHDTKHVLKLKGKLILHPPFCS